MSLIASSMGATDMVKVLFSAFSIGLEKLSIIGGTGFQPVQRRVGCALRTIFGGQCPPYIIFAVFPVAQASHL
jgi:hypothetical protein